MRPAAQRVDQRRLVDERDPRGVDQDRARLDAGDAGASRNPRVSSVSDR